MRSLQYSKSEDVVTMRASSQIKVDVAQSIYKLVAAPCSSQHSTHTRYVANLLLLNIQIVIR